MMMNVLQSTALHPHRSLNLEEYNLGDERLVYCPKLEIGISLNRSAVEIWDLCDGDHTLLEIAQELTHRFGFDDSDIVEELLVDVEATILQLGELGLVEIKS